jgi:hypothetical protein
MILFRKLTIPTLLILILYIYIPHFVNSFTLENYANPYSFSELHVNYEGGFIRRGLLGQLSLFFSPYINNVNFFGSIFSFLYLSQIFLFMIIISKFKNYVILIIFFSLSPALILFNIYDPESYMRKDVFFNLAILLHTIFASRNIEFKKNINEYKNFLTYCLIPFLFINILIHEVQIFFISIHLLISFVVLNKNFKFFFKSFFAKIYLVLVLPTILVFLNSGTPEQVLLITESLSQYGPQIIQAPFDIMKGNINLMLGQILKVMVYYTYIDFINFFLAFLLSIVLFLSVFSFLIEKKVLIIKKSSLKIYGLFFIPLFLVFIAGTDFGRWLNIISIHIVAFFLIFRINYNAVIFKKIFNSTIISFSVLGIFLFSYIFLWIIPTACCWFGLKVFSSSLFAQFYDSSIFYYNIINEHIVELPLNNFLK